MYTIKSIGVVLIISLLAVFGYGTEKEKPKSLEGVSKEIVSSSLYRLSRTSTSVFVARRFAKSQKGKINA